ncbi:MAG: hypothetical protein IKN81_05375 [Oscillospiraceae bacterium]|nr:hypothetical protein [Oscillospiraceae bacterium]
MSAKNTKEQSYMITNELGTITGKMRALTGLLFTIHSNMTDGGDIAESVYVASGYLEQLVQDLENVTAEVQDALKAE